jgi:hypothetical protein
MYLAETGKRPSGVVSGFDCNIRKAVGTRLSAPALPR